MAPPAPRIRFRLTAQDWVTWNWLASARRPERSWWRDRLEWVRQWSVYLAALLGGGYGSALAIGHAVDPRWWNIAFLVGALAVGGLMSGRVGASVEEDDFENSIFARAEVVVGLSDSGVLAEIGGLTMMMSWKEIGTVQRTADLVLVACDGHGSGIAMPLRAFADSDAMDAFIARIEAGRQTSVTPSA